MKQERRPLSSEGDDVTSARSEQSRGLMCIFTSHSHCYAKNTFSGVCQLSFAA